MCNCASYCHALVLSVYTAICVNYDGLLTENVIDVMWLQLDAVASCELNQPWQLQSKQTYSNTSQSYSWNIETTLLRFEISMK